MKYLLLCFLLLIIHPWCHAQQQHKKPPVHHGKKPVKKTTHYYPPKPKPAISMKVDKLTAQEAVLFNKVEELDSILISDSVVRYYRLENGQLVNFSNELMFNKNAEGFMEGSYVDDAGKETDALIDYQVTYTPLDSQNTVITYTNIINKTAIVDYGTIICYNGKITHLSRNCEGTRCRTLLKEGDKIIFEKDE